MERHLMVMLLLAICSNLQARDLTDIRYRFTDCNTSSSRRPPRFEECVAHYRRENSPILRDGRLFEVKRGREGAQGFKVPRAGLYNVTVAGAAGGRGLCGFEFGFGLVQEIQAQLTLDYDLLVLVGQQGQSPCARNNDILSVCNGPPPRNDRQAAACFNSWFESVTANYSTSESEVIYENVGGGGGGGASMVWPISVRNNKTTNLPLVISGGGGGGPANLTYNIIWDLLRVSGPFQVSADEKYREFLNAKQSTYDPSLGYQTPGVMGFRDISAVINAGAGGGWMQAPTALPTIIDGQLLSQSGPDFAMGGEGCATVLSIPTAGIEGGFGGGGGGCGGGGGGGGYTGGCVLWNGTGIAVAIPGGGGYSYYGEAPPANLNVTYIGYSLNTDRDGYVEIVLAECGCTHKCEVDVDTDQFECLCPDDSRLAPDQNDCFQATEINTTSTDVFIGSNGFYAEIFSFAATFIFSIDAKLSIVAPVSLSNTSPSRARTARDKSWGRRTGIEAKGLARETAAGDSFTLYFLGENSDIVLASNSISDSEIGTADSLMSLTAGNGNNTHMNGFTRFLTSSILVTGAVLVSTRPCVLEGMRIGVNASTRQADTGPINRGAVLETVNTTFLQSPEESSLPTSAPTIASSTTVKTVVIVVTIVVALVVISLIVIVILVYRSKVKAIKAKQLQLQSIERKAVDDAPRYVCDTIITPHSDELSVHIPKKLIVSKSQLQILDSVGQGEFGVVYRAKLIKHEGRETVAAKTLKGLFTPNDVQCMLDEVLKMQHFNHSHVMPLLGVCLDAGPGVTIIMPYMANGSLLSHLKNDRENLLLSQAADPEIISSVRTLLLRMCYQVAQGMEYLAQQKFVHRDLAARNCMLDIKGDIKVADFGLGEDIYQTGYFKQDKGNAAVKLPYKWMPLESLQDGLFSEKSDVWSFGVTCWEIFTAGKMPYPAVDPAALVEMLERGERLKKPSNSACSEEAYSIMEQCWCTEPDARPTFQELVHSLSPLLECTAGYVTLATMTSMSPKQNETSTTVYSEQ